MDFLLPKDSCLNLVIMRSPHHRVEEDRVDLILHVSTKGKLVKVAEAELLQKHELVLLQKEHSGCAALLRDDKVWGMCEGYKADTSSVDRGVWIPPSG